MGNIISSLKSDHDEQHKKNITNIELDINILREEILSLRNILEETTYTVSVKIHEDSTDKFENCYEKNTKEIDIDVIADLPFI